MNIVISLILSITFFFSITITMFISEESKLNPLMLSGLVVVLNAMVIYIAIK